VPLISLYSAQILLENASLCRQNVRLKNRLLFSKFFQQNLSKPTAWNQKEKLIVALIVALIVEPWRDVMEV